MFDSTASFPQPNLMAVLHYGADSSVRLEFADGVAAEECGTPRGSPVDDPAAAVAAALVQPLEYPPLAKTPRPATAASWRSMAACRRPPAWPARPTVTK